MQMAPRNLTSRATTLLCFIVMSQVGGRDAAVVFGGEHALPRMLYCAHLILMPRKNQTFSHQQNIWIVTNYGLQLWNSSGK